VGFHLPGQPGRAAEFHPPLARVRDEFLRAAGFTVLRFWNNEILADTAPVFEAILRAAENHPHPGPLREGEGEEPSNV
jgi:hypothetical protein